MKDLICIVCPRGCHLHIDDDKNVTGNFCPRGKEYALNEITYPKRMVTSTVAVKNRENMVVSVRTDKSIGKEKMFDVIKLIDNLEVNAPCHIGDILAENILGTDVNIIITKDID